MDELQEVLQMVLKYFPEATMEEISPIYQEIKQADPNITVSQIEQLMQQMIPQIQEKMMTSQQGVSDKDAKMDALNSMRG
jgi:inorganic pyrophosphatase/exopolyphosphatase